MKPLGPITDPIYLPASAYSATDRFFLQFIKDERDLPFCYLMGRISVTLVPLAVLLFMPFVTGWMFVAVAAGHFFASNFRFKGPFGLMLHCASHRPLFKPEYEWMNYYLTWFLAPFFGQTPETYYSHHIGMHHPENNVDPDDSTTMPYQRDSLRGFLTYFGQFFIFGVRDLLVYLRSKNRMKLVYRAIVGEVCFVTMCIALCFVSIPATIIVFLLPFVIYRLIAMLGNWTQHAFVDAEDPANPFKNSITCINVKYNHKCWNDGYHISHHQRPAMHWTEHPVFFQKTLDKYSQNQAIVFDGLDFLGVFYNLMRKRYDVLASHAVNVNGAFTSEAELIAVMRHRTRAIR